MTVPIRGAAAAFAAVAALVTPVPAHAVAPEVIVAYGGGFVPSEVVLVAGGTLTLVNADPLQPHDVTARNLRNGTPVFRTGPVASGGVKDVAGVSSLRPSVYPFYCTIHEAMVGNLTVVAAPAARRTS